MVDRSDSNDPKDWLAVADEDYGFARTNLKDPQTSYFAQICFHYQQATEKYLKAFIVAEKLEFKKTHELPTLLQICQKVEPSFDKFKDECNFLTEFYYEPRYPVILPVSNITRKDAEKAQSYAKTIGDFVKEKLKIKK